uniref:Uncharacterized protein n=1 Tax=Anguilla anguilla TaxID=7936 RepID=A0A0E9UA43_ANGAN
MIAAVLLGNSIVSLSNLAVLFSFAGLIRGTLL